MESKIWQFVSFHMALPEIICKVSCDNKLVTTHNSDRLIDLVQFCRNFGNVVIEFILTENKSVVFELLSGCQSFIFSRLQISD